MRKGGFRVALGLALSVGRAWGAGDGPADGGLARDAFVADRRGLMTVLGGWSLGSLAVGGAMWASSRPLVRYAGVQNVVWGVVDGAIAVYALSTSGRDAGREAPPRHWAEERAKLRQVFWINAALDVLYVAGGAALVTLGKRESLNGSGWGVVAQGGFLLAFDSAGALVAGP